MFDSDHYFQRFGFRYVNQVLKFIPNEAKNEVRLVEQLSPTGPLSLTVKYVSESVGFGLFTEEAIPANAFLGIYAGIYRPVSWWKPTLNPYCLLVPGYEAGKRYVIDALRYGNLFRFMNHKEIPNMGVKWVKKAPHLYSVAPIAEGAELRICYGKHLDFFDLDSFDLDSFDSGP